MRAHTHIHPSPTTHLALWKLTERIMSFQYAPHGQPLTLLSNTTNISCGLAHSFLTSTHSTSCRGTPCETPVCYGVGVEGWAEWLRQTAYAVRRICQLLNAFDTNQLGLVGGPGFPANLPSLSQTIGRTPCQPKSKELVFLNSFFFFPCVLQKHYFVVVWGFRNRLLTWGWKVSGGAPSRGR